MNKRGDFLRCGGWGGSQLSKLRDADVLFTTKFSPYDEIQLFIFADRV